MVLAILKRVALSWMARAYGSKTVLKTTSTHGGVKMYKQILKKTGCLALVLSLASSVFLVVHSEQVSAQYPPGWDPWPWDSSYVYCYVYCIDHCVAAGQCVRQDGSVGPPMSGYMGECCNP